MSCIGRPHLRKNRISPTSTRQLDALKLQRGPTHKSFSIGQ